MNLHLQPDGNRAFADRPAGRGAGLARRRAIASILLLAAAGPSHALYKIIAPDGTVTYTDRPPVNAQGRVIEVGKPEVPTQSEAPLPFALRETTRRFPVVLFSMPDCLPCERGRDLLQQRGVPYNERRADNDTDRETWQRIAGSPAAPVLTIGAQSLPGFAPDDWNKYLDAAGYPRTSGLPANFPLASVSPLVEKPQQPARPTTLIPAEPAPASITPPQPAPAATPASGIRF